MATRTLLYYISQALYKETTKTPIFALTDYDPDGIAIMSTYKYGSHVLSHENANLNVPVMVWLGVRSADICQNIERTTDNDDQRLLKLSARDRKKGIKMLENNVALAENGNEPGWRRELQLMLMLNVKAEMEILSDRDGGIAALVKAKLVTKMQDCYNRNI